MEYKENKRETGTRKEELAADFLTRRGVKILERNFRCRQGEIDLIGMDGQYLVFVEVKYRKTARNGMPAEGLAISNSSGYAIRRSSICTADITARTCRAVLMW